VIHSNHRAAVAEIRAAATWYAARSRVAAVGFLDAIDHAITTIHENPTAWAVRGSSSEIRAFMLARYPYLVVYRVQPHAIRVLAVAHARRRPDYWQRRK
jgi:plasmid stabilization system protein ParE